MKNALKVPELQAGKPEISMAPLIDVVFLLLIFFMVTTVFPDNKGLIIERPLSEHSEALPPRTITAQIDQHGTIFFKKSPLTLDQFTELVRTRKSMSADTSVLLQVDKRASTQSLISAMDACRDAGVAQIGIATDVDRKR